MDKLEEHNSKKRLSSDLNITETRSPLIPGRVTVSFSLSEDDWCLIRQSSPWGRILRYLAESQRQDSRMSLTERVDLLEKQEFFPT